MTEVTMTDERIVVEREGNLIVTLVWVFVAEALLVGAIYLAVAS